MKAIRIHEFGEVDKLSIDEIDRPSPGRGEVLVKMVAAGINYADIMMRRGNYLTKPPLPHNLGFEVAGTVEELGENVTGLSVGDRVVGSVLAGGYAEYVPVRTNAVMPIPDAIGFSEATALLVQGLTSLGLLDGMEAGRSILVHAAAGGVGSLLVQLAKHKGLNVIGTASSEGKLEKVTSLGADSAIDYTQSDWTEKVLGATGGKGADRIIEMVGGQIVGENLKVLAKNGTMIVYGAASGEDFRISVLSLMQKNHCVRGYWLANESAENRVKYTAELIENVQKGRLQIEVTEFPLISVVDAHLAIEGRKTTGKIVLVP